MSETVKTLFMFLMLVAALLLVLRITGWKMKKAANAIIEDLRMQGALDPASAVELPYSKEDFFRVGVRDYRPKALAALVTQDIIRIHEGKKYYLREGHTLQ
jgi:hypothetical protein